MELDIIKNVDYKESIKTIVLAGDLDISNAKKFKQILISSFDESGISSIEIDMLNAAYVDSSGIGTLVAAQKISNSRKKGLELKNVNPRIRDILSSASLIDFFKITKNS